MQIRQCLTLVSMTTVLGMGIIPAAQAAAPVATPAATTAVPASVATLNNAVAQNHTTVHKHSATGKHAVHHRTQVSQKPVEKELKQDIKK